MQKVLSRGGATGASLCLVFTNEGKYHISEVTMATWYLRDLNTHVLWTQAESEGWTAVMIKMTMGSLDGTLDRDLFLFPLRGSVTDARNVSQRSLGS